jgi:hypothetical protein
MEEEKFLCVYFGTEYKFFHCADVHVQLIFDGEFSINEIPTNIIFEDSEKLKYIKISSCENDLIDKNLRKKIFLYFLKRKIPLLDFVKKNKKTPNLCLDYLESSIGNISYGLNKKYLTLKFIRQIYRKNYYILHSFVNKKIIKRSESYYYF